MGMDEAHDVPGVWEVLRARRVPVVLSTLFIGVGVALLPALGAGLVPIVFGSGALLGELAAAAGAPVRAYLGPGLLALGLATLLGLAASLGVFVAPEDLWRSAVAFTVGTALMGAALAPLAYAPIAAAQSERPLREGLTRAIDVAGGDALSRLAPLCALIAVLLLVPVPLLPAALARGVFGGSAAWLLVSGASFVVWMGAVPVSGAVLTTRYLRLVRRHDAPTRLGGAVTPVIGAALVGGLCLAVAGAVSLSAPRYARSMDRDGPLAGAPLRGSIDWEGPHVVRADWNALYVGGERLALSRDRLTACAYEAAGAEATVRCDAGDRRFEVRIDRHGAIPLDPVAAVSEVATAPVIVALTLALLSLALALYRLGRLGVKLRLLLRPPHTLEGWVEAPDDDGPLRFEAADGARRVHVPWARLASADDAHPGPRSPATLVSVEPIAAMGYRGAHAPCPPHALLVLGGREEALARQMQRARRIGFRLAVVTLGSLACAATLLLLDVVTAS